MELPFIVEEAFPESSLPGSGSFWWSQEEDGVGVRWSGMLSRAWKADARRGLKRVFSCTHVYPIHLSNRIRITYVFLDLSLLTFL